MSVNKDVQILEDRIRFLEDKMAEIEKIRLTSPWWTAMDVEPTKQIDMFNNTMENLNESNS